jgi:hypothetical protein
MAAGERQKDGRKDGDAAGNDPQFVLSAVAAVVLLGVCAGCQVDCASSSINI